MQANYINQPMSQEKLEQLEALTKVMMLSFLWQSSGLMETSTKTKQNTKKQSPTNPETNYPQEK